LHLDVRSEIRSLTERDSLDGLDDATRERNSLRVRHLSLSVYAQALSMCSQAGCLSRPVEEERWFIEELLPSLLADVMDAEASATIAYDATRCINSLVSCSRKALFSVDQDGLNALKQAREFGKMRHELLEQETEQCIQVLEASRSN
jgi:hypothetical protein